MSFETFFNQSDLPSQILDSELTQNLEADNPLNFQQKGSGFAPEEGFLPVQFTANWVEGDVVLFASEALNQDLGKISDSAESAWFDYQIINSSDTLQKLIADPDFSTKMQIAFGDRSNPEAIENLIEDLVNGSGNPHIEVLPAANLNGANGAYDRLNNSIYLSREFLEQNANNPKIIETVVLEEIGHYLDSQLGPGDALGDEGEILAQLAQGIDLAPEEISVLKAQNDRTTIFLNGQKLEIEQSSNPDFNGDGLPDILWRHYPSGNNGAWLLNGTNYSSSLNMTREPNSNWRIQGAGDFDGDGREDDILWRNYQNGDNAVWLMDGENKVAGQELAAVSNLNWRIQGVGNFDGDNLEDDILWRNYETGENVVWLMDNGNEVGVALSSETNLNWQIGGTGDFSGDGNSDILWRNYATGENKVQLMNGTTEGSEVSLESLADTNWRMSGTGDYNNDGNIDILWRNYTTGENNFWLMNNTSKNSEVALLSASNLDWEIGLQDSLPEGSGNGGGGALPAAMNSEVIKFSPEQNEQAIAATGAANLTIGTQTIYVGTWQASGNNQNPIIASFDSQNPDNNWVKTDYESTGADGRGLGLFWDGTNLFAAFTTDGTQGNSSQDWRRATGATGQFSWLNSYGMGGGTKISVVGRIDPATGDLTDAAYLSAVLANGRTNAFTVTDLSVNGSGNLVVDATSRFHPRNPNGSRMTIVDTSVPQPFDYTIELTPDLDTVVSTSAPGWDP